MVYLSLLLASHPLHHHFKTSWRFWKMGRGEEGGASKLKD